MEWILIGRLAVSLWLGMPQDMQEIVLNTASEEFAKEHHCGIVQIIVLTTPEDKENAYFVARCLNESEVREIEPRWIDNKFKSIYN